MWAPGTEGLRSIPAEAGWNGTWATGLVRCRASGELKRLGSELRSDGVNVRFEPFFFDLDAKFHRGLIRAGCG